MRVFFFLVRACTINAGDIVTVVVDRKVILYKTAVSGAERAPPPVQRGGV